MVSKKQQAHVRKYVEGHYWRPTIYLPRATEAPIRAFCEERGISVNEMINKAIEAYMALNAKLETEVHPVSPVSEEDVEDALEFNQLMDRIIEQEYSRQFKEGTE